jgi:hypothetical protein
VETERIGFELIEDATDRPHDVDVSTLALAPMLYVSPGTPSETTVRSARA